MLEKREEFLSTVKEYYGKAYVAVMTRAIDNVYKMYGEITPKSVSEYEKHLKAIGTHRIPIGQALNALYRFMDFRNGISIIDDDRRTKKINELEKELKPKPKPKKKVKSINPLTDIVKNESYVDKTGILRITYSNLPALECWVCTAEKLGIQFDKKATLKARRKHRKLVEKEKRKRDRNILGCW